MSRQPPHDTPQVETALDQAEDALDLGDPEAALEIADQILAAYPEHPGALYLTAEAFHDLGDYEEAERRYRRCTQLVPEHASSWSGLAVALLDQLRYDEATQVANRAIRVDERNPEAYHLRALLRERRGDVRGAERDDRRAFRLDPDRYPVPLALDDATIEAVVTEAIAACPDSVRDALANVPVILEELPTDEVCNSFDPPRSPIDLVGLFSGPTLAEMGTDAVWTQALPAITLYRKNLQRVARDRTQLLDEVRVTLVHEIGHFLGLSEEDLEDRGLH